MSFAAGSRRDFGRRDFRFSARNLARSKNDPSEILATVNLLLGEKLGEIRGRIPARFWLPGFLLPGKNLGEIRGRILARFWPPGFLLPGEKLGKIEERSQRDFGRPEFNFPGRILPGSRRDSRRDFGGIPPRSRSLFYKGKASSLSARLVC